jgi:hypothetical protein
MSPHRLALPPVSSPTTRPMTRRLASFRFVPLLALATGSLALTACGDSPLAPPLRFEEVQWAASLGINPGDFTELPTGVWIRDDQVGAGTAAADGLRARMDYRGFLPNGTRFDSSLDTPGREPLNVLLGASPRQLIRGFELGARGMRPGGVRTVLIPPFLGYGVNPPPGSVIPPNSWLVFEIHLLEVMQP